MKKNLFNITKALLLGLAFVAVGCSDYDEDIKDLNNRIDAVTSKITGEIDLTKVDLDNTKKDLNSAKETLAALQVKHDADIAALKASDETLKSSIADANAAIVALKGDLSAAEAALNDKVDGVQAELNAKIAAEIATVNEKIAAAEAQIEGLKANVSELNSKDAELDKKIADLGEDMAALKAELNALISKNADGIAANADAIKALQNNMAQQAQIFVDYKAAVAAQIAALEAKDAQIESSIATINDAIVRIDASIEAIQSGKVNVKDFEAYQEEVKAQYTTLEDAIFALEYADIKFNKTDKELSDRIYNLKTNLEKRLDEAFGNIGANTSAIAALQSEVAANLAKINATNSTLNSAIEEFTSAIEALEAKDEALDAKDEELSLEIVAKYAELAKEIEALEANDEAIQAKCDDLKAQIEAEIANRTAADAAINTDLKAKYDELIANCEALAKADEVILAKIDAEVKKLAAKDDEISKIVAANYAELTTKAAGLQDQINMLMLVNGVLTAENKEQAAALEALATQYEELANDLLAKYEELKEADAALAQADKDLENALTTKFAEDLQKSDAKEAVAFAEVWEKIEAMDADLAAKYAELVGKDDELAGQIVALTATVEDNTDRIAELESSLAALEKDYEAYKARIDKVVNDLKDHIVSVEGNVVKLNEETTAAFETMKVNLEKAIAGVEQTIEDVKKELETNINKLMNRIQSIVYVPEYDDGKATIKFAKMFVGEGVNEPTIIEAASKMKYQVYPAACAQAIADAYKANNSTLSFDVRPVKPSYTRSGAAPAALNIKSVDLINDEDGVIEITFEARNFSDAFYNIYGDVIFAPVVRLNGDETKEDEPSSYSASLIVDYKGDLNSSSANLSSCYTALAPSRITTEIINVALDGVELDEETNHAAPIAIPYTLRNSPNALEYADFPAKGKKNILEGLCVVYTIDGGETKYSWKEMADMGYAITAPEYSYEVEAYSDNDETAAEGGLAYFSYNTIGEGTLEPEAPMTVGEDNTVQPVVWLTEEAIDETVGTQLCYTAKYNAMGVELEAKQNVVIDPYTVSIEGTISPIVWNYDLDAQQDAYAFDADDETVARYEREKLVVNFTDEMLAKLDKSITFQEIFTQPMGGKTFNGEALTAATVPASSDIKIAAEGNNVTIDIANFEWNKEDNVITYVYNHPSVKLDLKITFATEGRSNEPVKIEKEASVALYKDIQFEAFAKGAPEAMDLASIYTTLKDVYDLGKFEAEGKQNDFLTEVLAAEGEKARVDNKFVAISTAAGGSVNVPDLSGTFKLFAIENNAAGIGYHYNIVTGRTITYTKKFNLWYGQPVELVYTVNFTDPAAGYDFAHNDLWVFESEEFGYASQVQGRYTKSNGTIDKMARNIAKFGVDNIDMDKAFNVVDAEGKLYTDEELDSLGIVTAFDFVNKPEKDADGITFDGNVITYNDKAPSVQVKGKLYLEHSNGAKIEIATPSFAENGAYANYNVLKFDPLTDITANDSEVEITDVTTYSVKALSLFDIYESRDGDNKPSELNEGTIVNLITEKGAWMKGDGSNGWTTGAKYSDIYPSLEPEFADVNIVIPDAYRNEKAITWDAENGVLTFDNTPNMKLVKEVEIPITLTITYTWGVKTATANVVFTTPEIKANK